jgi:putative glycosyltransferase (TIGR04372 family)
MLRFFFKSVSWVVLPACVFWWVVQFVRYLPKVRDAEVIFMDPHLMNFGTAVIGIDLCQRKFKGKRIVYLLSWIYSGTTNRHLGEIWPDINVLPINLFSFRIYIFGKWVELPGKNDRDKILLPVVSWVISVFAPKAHQLTIEKLNKNTDVPPSLQDEIPEDYWTEDRWALHSQALWSYLVSTCDVSELRFPEPYKKQLHDELKERIKDKPAKLCMFYTRYDAHAPGYSRNGSELNAYIPAITELIGRGYQILHVGDLNYDEAFIEQFDGMFVEQSSFGKMQDLFRLFVPIEADICIGDSGAGLLIPTILQKPMLVLNAHPIAHCCGMGPKSWVYPKRYINKTGEQISYKYIFGEIPYLEYGPGDVGGDCVYPLSNSEGDITHATTRFLDDLGEESNEEVGEDIVKLLPKRSFFRICNARLSPAWERS